MTTSFEISPGAPPQTGGPAPQGPVAPTAGALSAVRPVSHDAVTLTSSGWLGQWQRRNLDRTLPHVMDQLERGEAVANLARLTQDEDDRPAFRGMVFTDTDVHKTLEALAWAAPQLGADHPLMARGNELVRLLAQVQEPDGYLNSYVQGTPGLERWQDPQWGHELYTAGHLLQAGVAAARNGVFPELVDVAVRCAGQLLGRFGPNDPYVEGHPEVETALVELFRELGDQRHLLLAAHQIAVRGHGWLGEDRFGSNYFQDAVPLRQAGGATGHAVRQLYLLAGAVDVAVETGDAELLAAVERVSADLQRHRTYVTGATGSRHRDEAIGDAYELPADRAYAESCAAIASFQLNWRLLLATGSAQYADAAETVLFNALAASTSISGTEFFYSNPLQLRTGHDGSHEDAPAHRLPWYACACCPPNIARFLATAHDYVVTTSEAGLAIQLPTAATVRTTVAGGPVTVTIATSYPWSGAIEVEVSTEVAEAWELSLRIPAWCRRWRLTVAGEDVHARADDGYVRIRRVWSGWSSVRLELDTPVRWIEPNPRIDAVRGCVALARGPVLYCLEGADVPAGTILEDLVLREVEGPVWPGPDGLAPVLVRARFGVRNGSGPLYRDRSEDSSTSPEPSHESGTGQDIESDLRVDLIPYHGWANREPGAMRVWVPTAG